MSEYQKLMVDQLESSVEFLTWERLKHSVESTEYRQLTKELVQAQVQLHRERAK